MHNSKEAMTGSKEECPGDETRQIHSRVVSRAFVDLLLINLMAPPWCFTSDEFPFPVTVRLLHIE